MSRAPLPKVAVQATQVRDDGRSRPYLVRWTVDGVAFSEGFASKKLADVLAAQLTLASVDAERFSPATGRPIAWSAASDLTVATWCHDYLAREWASLAPNTRRSRVETLERVVLLTAPGRAPVPTAAQRLELQAWLRGGAEPGTSLCAWLKRWSPALEDMDGPALRRLDAGLRLRLDGGPLGSATAGRHVTVARRCFEQAVLAGVMSEAAWPKADRGASSRKSSRRKQAPAPASTVSGSALTLAQFRQLVAALPTHQPRSLAYQAMTAIGGYAGLRPGETVALEAENLCLPEVGWGSIRVVQSWNGTGSQWGSEDEDVAEPKTATSVRTVPIPPVLVELLRGYLQRSDIAAGPLFLTRSGQAPGRQNWGRALQAAAQRAGVPAPTPYGLRRMAASHLVDEVPLAEAAARLGHSVEVLCRHYVRRVAGQEERANAALEALYETA